MEIIPIYDKYSQKKVWYITNRGHILTLKESADDALEFIRLYKGVAKKYGIKNQIKEFFRWLTLIFCL